MVFLPIEIRSDYNGRWTNNNQFKHLVYLLWFRAHGELTVWILFYFICCLVSQTTSNEMLLAHIYWILPIGHIIKNLNIFSQQNCWLWSSQSSGLRYCLWVHNLRVRFSRYALNYAVFGQFFFFRSLLNSISYYYWLFMVLKLIMLVSGVYCFLVPSLRNNYSDIPLSNWLFP